MQFSTPAASGRALLLALALLLGSASLALGASFVVEKSEIRVKAPGFAATYPSAIGDFGVPAYGAVLVGAVAYLPGNAQGCSDIQTKLPAGVDILLVDRGGCYFVEKAWHAQQAGAKAVVVADNVQEQLLTMAVPEDHPDLAALVAKISIPTSLVTKDVGDKIKSLLAAGPGGGGAGGAAPPGQGQVQVELDWSDAITNPDSRVEWELWFTTNDACGAMCSAQSAFFASFQQTAVSLQREGYVAFEPHVMLRTCLWDSPDCDRDCTHHRRYCAVEPVPARHSARYSGASVVEMNTRHLCAFQVANNTGQGWRWWDFAGRFAGNCTMDSGRFDQACANEQLAAAGIDTSAVEGCAGRADTDATHPLLEAQLAAQADAEESGRGRVIMLPTVVINTVQYRGRLGTPDVLRALCAGFQEGTEPAVCLTGGLEVDDCASGNHQCWTKGDLSACHDTFRGFVCRCPKGYEGDGHVCTDVDECALGIAGCDQTCVNTEGSYYCECELGYTLHGGKGAPGICLPNALGKAAAQTHLPAWMMALLFAAAVASLSLAGVAAYRWRMRRDMHHEIRAIMRDYMPLDSQPGEETGRGLLGGMRAKIPARRASQPEPIDEDLEYAAPQMATELASKRPGGGPL